MRTTSIGLLTALCAFTFALQSGEAGKKKKAKVPKGVVETLLGPGEWVLANESGDELTLRSVNQRKVGKAKVATLEWTTKVEWSLDTPPVLIASTKKGIHLLSPYEMNGVDDAKLAKLLKKRKPDFKYPLKAGSSKMNGDFNRFLAVKDGNVCVGYTARGMCGGMGCDAEICMGSMGLASLSGGYSPDEMQWNWVAGGLTVADTTLSDPGEQAIADLTPLRDRACACKDKACAEAVVVDLDAWTKTHASTSATQAQLDVLTKLGTELGSCIGNFGVGF